jgi:hypothetical protein
MWYVFADNDCPAVDEIHLADIHEPLSVNPGWEFHYPFGMNGIVEAFAAFQEAKRQHENVEESCCSNVDGSV